MQIFQTQKETAPRHRKRKVFHIKLFTVLRQRRNIYRANENENENKKK